MVMAVGAVASVSRPPMAFSPLTRSPSCAFGRRICLQLAGIPARIGVGASAAHLQFCQQRSFAGGAKLLESAQFSRRRGRRRCEFERRRGAAVTTRAGMVDPHAWAFLAEAFDPSKLPVAIELDPTREIIDEAVVSRLSESAIKACYMVGVLVFSWGCCVFGSMNETFYDSDEYLDAGGDGSGHWIYDRQEREEAAAREEIWSDDLLKEIEDKAAEVRRGEDDEKKKREVELV